jgi:hypothetical protein
MIEAEAALLAAGTVDTVLLPCRSAAVIATALIGLLYV